MRSAAMPGTDYFSNTGTAASRNRCIPATTQMLKLFIFAFFTIYLTNCQSNSKLSQTLDQVKDNPVVIAQINDLVTNKSKYHGKWVETVAYYSYGFEKSELYYDSTLPTLDGKLNFRVYHAIWVEFHYSHPYAQHLPDSVNHKLVRIRGKYDSTKTGHLGYYSAGITNTYLMKVINSDSE